MSNKLLRPFSYLIFALLPLSALQSQSFENQVYFAQAVFFSPEHGPYVELYTTVDAQTIAFREESKGRWQGQLNLEITFPGFPEFDRDYAVLSPLIPDSGLNAFNFVDLRRLPIPKGESFEMHISLEDKNQSQNRIVQIGAFEAFEEPRQGYISDLQLIDRVGPASGNAMTNKMGLSLSPFPFPHFPKGADSLKFYFETYRLQEPSLVLVELGRKGSEKILKKLVKPLMPAEVQGSLVQWDISDLETGTYFIRLSSFSKAKEAYFQRQFEFSRQQDDLAGQLEGLKEAAYLSSFVGSMALEDIRKYLPALSPIANQEELPYIKQLKGEADSSMQKRFFHHFWISRHPETAYTMWKRYKQKVDYVMENYSAINKEGYETDRGRVFLKYGEPDDLIRQSFDPGTPPYEQWTYFSIDNLGKKEFNVKFVFFDPNIASNDPKLIHSTAIGEIKDPLWKQKVYRGIPGPNRNTLDRFEVPHSFGSGLEGID